MVVMTIPVQKLVRQNTYLSTIDASFGNINVGPLLQCNRRTVDYGNIPYPYTAANINEFNIRCCLEILMVGIQIIFGRYILFLHEVSISS